MRGERTEPYKEDSTKGNSLINPLNYKGDVLVQVWVDSRVLATLCGWLDDKGTYTRYMSQVVRRPLEVLVDLLVNSGDAKLIDSTADAREILSRRFGVNLNRDGRGTKNVMHNIELSIRREDLSESLHRENRIYDARKPLNQKDPKIAAIVAEARKKHAELFPDTSKGVTHYDYDEPKEEAKKVDNDKVVRSEDAAEFVRVSRVKEELSPMKERGNSTESLRKRIQAADEESQEGLDALNNMSYEEMMKGAKKDKIV